MSSNPPETRPVYDEEMVFIEVLVNGRRGKIMAESAEFWDSLSDDERADVANDFASEQNLVDIDFKEIRRGRG